MDARLSFTDLAGLCDTRNTHGDVVGELGSVLDIIAGLAVVNVRDGEQTAPVRRLGPAVVLDAQSKTLRLCDVSALDLVPRVRYWRHVGLAAGLGPTSVELEVGRVKGVDVQGDRIGNGDVEA